MSKFTFTPAVRTGRGARMAIVGPSGSGKTYTALTFASAMGTKVAGLDTESMTMRLYSDLFRFDTTEVDTYDPRDLIAWLAEAASARYDAVVIDSWSHFWSGEGGMLDFVDASSKGKSGSTFNNGWKAATPVERDMMRAIKAYPGHVILTLRTKTEWVIEQNERGRHEPKKVGTKPDQRDQFEYELDVVGTLDLDNTLTIQKTRCPLIAGVHPKPTGELGVTLRDWLDSGVSAPNAQDLRDRAYLAGATADELRSLWEQARDAGLLRASVLTDEGRAVPLTDLLSQRAAAVNTPRLVAPLDTTPAQNGQPQQSAPASGEKPPPPPAEIELIDGKRAVIKAAVECSPKYRLANGDPDIPVIATEYTRFMGNGAELKNADVDELRTFAEHLTAQAPARAA